MSTVLRAAPRAALAIIGAVIVTFAACSDEQHPTSPVTSSRAVAAPRTNTASSSDWQSDNGTPFKAVFVVTAPAVTAVPFSTPTELTATCPAGSQPIGATWLIGNFFVSQHLSLVESQPNAANGWTLTVRNSDNLGPDVLARARVTCIR
jgi:hypothetical protein